MTRPEIAGWLLLASFALERTIPTPKPATVTRAQTAPTVLKLRFLIADLLLCLPRRGDAGERCQERDGEERDRPLEPVFAPLAVPSWEFTRTGAP